MSQATVCAPDDDGAEANTTTRANINGGTSTTASTTINPTRPLILITDSNWSHQPGGEPQEALSARRLAGSGRRRVAAPASASASAPASAQASSASQEEPAAACNASAHASAAQGSKATVKGSWTPEEQVEEVDGIRYRIVAAVTKPPVSKERPFNSSRRRSQHGGANASQEPVIMEQESEVESLSGANGNIGATTKESPISGKERKGGASAASNSVVQTTLNSVRRKSSAFVSSLLHSSSLLGPNSNHNSAAHQLEAAGRNSSSPRPRRLSIYEMTKSPPPETSLEIYLSERRRSSTVSAKQIQQQLEQQSTFETNYCQRQQYFKDLNQKLINHDNKLLNVVSNRGQIHRHSVDIAQLPLHLAGAKWASRGASSRIQQNALNAQQQQLAARNSSLKLSSSAPKGIPIASPYHQQQQQPDKSNQLLGTIDQFPGAIDQSGGAIDQPDAEDADQRLQQGEVWTEGDEKRTIGSRLVPIRQNRSSFDRRGSVSSWRSSDSRTKAKHQQPPKAQIVIRKFQKLDETELSSTPAPDVKIGQRIAHKEYYGNEFGTIRWIGRVPQISPDWTVGVEFDNAIGGCDGSLNGRRYFIAKDCFARFLPLSDVALVDQHVGRPEPGTMISVMSAAVRPGQMISIQRVSTVHVQHCFLNAPHRRPGADILAVNTRLHCQCPNCGPCAHVIKPPRTQRLSHSGKNATHMCQFSTYTCCGMESQEETMCTYTGNKVVSLPPPVHSSSAGLPPIGNSWIEGSGYLTNLQAQQSKLMPQEYRLGAAPEDISNPESRRRLSKSSSGRGSGRRHRHHHHHSSAKHTQSSPSPQEGAGNVVTNGQSLDDPPPNYIADEGEYINSTAVKAEQPQRQQQQPQQLHSDYQLGQQDDAHYLPQSHSPVSSNPPSFNQAVEIAYQDKASFCYDNEAGGCKVNHDEPSCCKTNEIISKSANVVYRDSIENRYLFPTDDGPIDSTLEADLENLSQARYGHSTNSRLYGSRNIFKSLRSLVSCLSAQSNQSESGKHSENTFRFSDGRANYANKSMPEVVQTRPSDFYGSNHFHHAHPIAYGNDDNFEYKQTNSSLITHNGHDKQNESQQKRPIEQANFRGNIISSSSDCGFSSASQNSVNFHSHRAHSPIMSAEEDWRTNRIYKRILARLMSSTSVSSEDLIRLKEVLFGAHYENCCLHNNQTNFNILNTSEADQIIADIIQKSCLKQGNLGLEQQFKKTMPSTSAAYCQATSYCISSSSYERDHKIEHNGHSLARDARYKKMPDGPLNAMTQSSLLLHANDHQSKSFPRSLIDGSSTSESITLSSNDSFCGSTAIMGADERPMSGTNNDGGKKRDTATIDGRASSNTTLPKAFELKLTLSINSEKKDEIHDEKSNDPVDYSNESNGIGGQNKILNPTFNINIISTQKEDPSESTKKVVPGEEGEEMSDTVEANPLEGNTDNMSKLMCNSLTITG